MAKGRIKTIAAAFLGGTAEGIGQAMRDVTPLEKEADAAMMRCIEQLDHIELVIKGRLENGDSAKD